MNIRVNVSTSYSFLCLFCFEMHLSSRGEIWKVGRVFWLGVGGFGSTHAGDGGRWAFLSDRGFPTSLCGDSVKPLLLFPF